MTIMCVNRVWTEKLGEHEEDQLVYRGVPQNIMIGPLDI